MQSGDAAIPKVQAATPSGCDLHQGPTGGSAHQEIALAPLVDDIVLVDPVCGMTVYRARARHLAERDGVVYAFCRIGSGPPSSPSPGRIPGPFAPTSAGA